MSSGHDRVSTAHRPCGDPHSLQIIVSVPRRTHYTTLGVRPDATATEIRVAYRDLARRLHPDRTAPTGSAAPSGGAVRGGEMAAVNEAYRVLSDPGRRVVYDRSLDEVPPAGGAASAPFAADPDDPDDEAREVAPMRPNVLAPAGPARVPWRMMGVLAVVGSGVVLVSSLFDDPAATAKPDGIIEPGSCVAFEVNGDAREVVCGTADDIVVRVARAPRRRVPCGHRRPPRSARARDRVRGGMKGWMAGLGVAVIAAVALGVLLLVVATSSDETLVLDLEPGQCFDLAADDGADAIGTVETTPCDEPHEAEAVAVGEVEPATRADDVPRPADDVLFEQVDARCAAALDGRPVCSSGSGSCPWWPTRRRGPSTTGGTSAWRSRTAVAPPPGRPSGESGTSRSDRPSDSARVLLACRPRKGD